MSIKVICKTTKEREEELHCLFEKMKPYLMEGKSYNQALKLVKNTKTNTNYNHTRWYRDLIKYGESQGFYKDDFEYPNKRGILNVQLMKYRDSLTGYYWTYTYYDEKFNKRRIMDIDLNKLKERVIEKGLQWTVINQFKTEKSYKLNEKLLQQKRPKKIRNKWRTTSGVKHVSRLKHKHAKKGYYWGYKTDGIFLQATTLKKLERRIKEHNLKWEILNKEKYEENIKNDY